MASSSSALSGSSAEMPEGVRKNAILARKVWPRMYVENSNWMAIVVGEPGDGKSYAALRLAEVLYPEFGIEDVCWSVRELMETANDKSVSRGHITVLEEGGIAAGNREWWDKANQALDQLTQTWRHQNRGLIVSVPDLDLIDSHVRRRFTHYIEMVGVDKDAGLARAKIQYIDVDHKGGKPYFKYHRMVDGNGIRKKYRYLDFSLPSESILEEYENDKDEFTSELNERLLESLTPDEEEEERNPRDIVDEIGESGAVDDYISTSPGGDYIDRALLKLDYNLSENESKVVKKLLVREHDLDVM